MLRRAAAALDEIAAEPGQLRLVDLGERLGLAKSTTRRLLVGLVEVGLASVDSHGRFSLGDRLLGFGGAAGAHISAIFRPTIERVARATDGETVDLSILRGQRMWFVDQIESSHRLRAVSAVGVRFPLDVTANGKAALAALDEADARGGALPVRAPTSPTRCAAKSPRSGAPESHSIATNTPRGSPRPPSRDGPPATTWSRSRCRRPPSAFSRRSSASSQHCAPRPTRRPGRGETEITSRRQWAAVGDGRGTPQRDRGRATDSAARLPRAWRTAVPHS